MTTPNSLSRRTFMTGLAGAALIGAAGCSPAQQQAQSSATASGSAASATITVRLWDEQVQKAYDASFAEFRKANPGITVKTSLVPWADYFTKLRTDVGGGSADDIFMMNGSYLQPYTSGSVIEIGSPTVVLLTTVRWVTGVPGLVIVAVRLLVPAVQP